MQSCCESVLQLITLFSILMVLFREYADGSQDFVPGVPQLQAPRRHGGTEGHPRDRHEAPTEGDGEKKTPEKVVKCSPSRLFFLICFLRINEKWLKEGSSDYVLRTKSYRPGSNGKDDKGGKT